MKVLTKQETETIIGALAYAQYCAPSEDTSLAYGRLVDLFKKETSTGNRLCLISDFERREIIC